MLDIDQLLSMGIVTFSLLLTGASLIAYKWTGLRKFSIVSPAFLLYAVKELVEHMDMVFMDREQYPGAHDESRGVLSDSPILCCRGH